MRPSLAVLAGVALVTALSGCGDPVVDATVQNQTSEDYILEWTESGSYYAGAVNLPAHATGLVLQEMQPEIDYTFLLLTPSCQLAWSVQYSGKSVALVVREGGDGVLDTTKDGPVPANLQQLTNSTACLSGGPSLAPGASDAISSG
jgi:hypothetical protein